MPRIVIRRGVINISPKPHGSAFEEALALARKLRAEADYEEAQAYVDDFEEVVLPALRYAVTEGYVIAHDGDRHFITYNNVIRAYGVNPIQCLRIRPMQAGRGHVFDMARAVHLGLILLEPDPTGQYDLSKCGRVQI